jgi:hypothetical protein
VEGGYNDRRLDPGARGGRRLRAVRRRDSDPRVSRPRVLSWMRRTFASAFVALGAELALAER